MVLKKQTVWLLTMLSLIVVLSVYYISTPPSNTPTSQSATPKQSEANKDSKDGMASSHIVNDDALADYRLQKQQADKEQAQQYEKVIDSDKSTAVQVSEAQDKLQSIETMNQKESLLEGEIKSKGFDDAVVSASGSDVNVYVKAGSISNKQANEIMRMVNSELGDVHVSVEREPVK
ncbi:stage III sporulation protein AH [Pullulanibacillus camelliae]|uniref:Stage III sporulation protein AH n=1 Tax=Pullulanibacillus camelliae TaxID=1707096 RepID=A0A8J2YIU9_9BACL|nr:SpoIIIAH-like family protein [Pullulanibacillus camelliae]GGE46559.1 stage III sporulation protein AH [Pullulanibacillus camelliae]